MLDLRFKSLCIVSSFVGREQGVVFVEEYDRKSLYLVLIKCHQHLHPLVRSDRNFVGKNTFDHDCNLDIFEQTISTSYEPPEEFGKRELLIFKRYQLEQWWRKHEAMKQLDF
jgi:hypothetical protein